ncbi:MAG TPA: bifunctional diguanylate cyclase/phosphodiesterase [Acidimicrobiales bacterium]|jgi:diguanylate cyclase (GGDEF)-like protein|nr:bifunctional diguanylate cyclase/phosphodiesterase [Acidimicrobiales bacterium]
MAPVPEERRHGGRLRFEIGSSVGQVLDPSADVVMPSVDPAMDAEELRRQQTKVRLGYVVLGVLLVAYFISLLIRRSDQHWLWLDGWSVAGFEFVASLICIYKGLARRPGRIIPLLLGFSLLSWSLGDVVLTTESIGGASPPTPSGADAFYLLFYPLAYVATVIILQRGLGRLARPNWLDGVVAGLGASTLCAAFAFHSIQNATGGSSLQTATNLSYPVGDLLLLLLVIGGTVLLSGGASRQWYVLATGLSAIVIGDTFNLFDSSGVASRFGSTANAIAWPIAIYLISMSVWLPARHLDPLRPQKVSSFLFPGIAATGGLIILIIGTLREISRVALWLAVATLFTVGIRLAISARSLRVLTEERHRQAHTDELTGLGNRRLLSQMLDLFFTDQEGSAEQARELAFLFVDLNHFKEINDSFGHPAGDELLRQLGPRLTSAVGSSGSVVRLGGDELAVVLMDADANDAVMIARKIIEGIEEPFTLNRIKATVGASIGIALVPANANDGPGLMWCADVAMYRAKLGNTPFVFYDQELDGGQDQPNLLDELRQAVKEGDFVLHYQPQLDLKTGEILAVEALVRWPHPKLGLVPPMKFLPLAEESGLMWPLTKWVLNEAFTQCAEWRADGRFLAVSVNVATSDLLEQGFLGLIRELLVKHDLPGESVVIEITETTIITDFLRAQAVILQLRDMGIVVSIDDFGAGFTSLAYLSSLAVGELKLDRTFITTLSAEGNGREMELVRATINLGHDMGLRVVAEGIEDVETLDLLGDLGCDLAQGYYISRPSPANKLSFKANNVKTLVAPSAD